MAGDQYRAWTDLLQPPVREAQDSRWRFHSLEALSTAMGLILRASASPIVVAAVKGASVPAERHRARREDDRQRKRGEDGVRSFCVTSRVPACCYA